MGLISDTHGQVRPDVHTALAGVDVILHAGDVGEGVLDELESDRAGAGGHGNTDDPGDPRLEAEIVYEVDGVAIHVSHGHETGTPTPAKLFARYPQQVIVYGHTHRQLETRDGIRLAINPGAAGPRRFRLEPSVVRLTVRDGVVETEIVRLVTGD